MEYSREGVDGNKAGVHLIYTRNAMEDVDMVCRKLTKGNTTMQKEV